MQISADTPREDFTIAKQTFSGAHPFTPGHTLTEGEARALNQTFIENVRNNLAKLVKSHIEAGTFDQAAMQGKVDEYMNEYEFGIRATAGPRPVRTPRDVVGTRAMELARAQIRKAILKQGGSLKDVSAKDITEKAKELVESDGRYRAKAEQQLAEEAELEVSEISVPGLDSAGTETKGKRAKAA
ncbi:MAG: hypothetical protein KGL39_58975 [Patescibacteria group bacterium]|nr:hypothetical protein [Patescibacteria group bacterium]